jgi:hypothetical protein
LVTNITVLRNGLADDRRSHRLLEGVVTAGRRLSDAGSDARRAIIGVVAWIMVLLIGYWLVADWQSLPALAHTLLSSVH